MAGVVPKVGKYRIPSDVMSKMLPWLQPRQTKRILDALQPERELEDKQHYWKKLFEETFPFMQIKKVRWYRIDYHKRFKNAYQKALKLVEKRQMPLLTIEEILKAIKGHSDPSNNFRANYFKIISALFGKTLPPEGIDFKEMFKDAIARGHIDVLKYLLKHHKASFSISAAFDAAFRFERPEIISFLIERQARQSLCTGSVFKELIAKYTVIAVGKNNVMFLEVLHARLLKYHHARAYQYFEKYNLDALEQALYRSYPHARVEFLLSYCGQEFFESPRHIYLLLIASKVGCLDLFNKHFKSICNIPAATISDVYRELTHDQCWNDAVSWAIKFAAQYPLVLEIALKDAIELVNNHYIEKLIAECRPLFDLPLIEYGISEAIKDRNPDRVRYLLGVFKQEITPSLIESFQAQMKEKMAHNADSLIAEFFGGNQPAAPIVHGYVSMLQSLPANIEVAAPKSKKSTHSKRAKC